VPKEAPTNPVSKQSTPTPKTPPTQTPSGSTWEVKLKKRGVNRDHPGKKRGTVEALRKKEKKKTRRGGRQKLRRIQTTEKTTGPDYPRGKGQKKTQKKKKTKNWIRRKGKNKAKKQVQRRHERGSDKERKYTASNSYETCWIEVLE